MVFFCLMLLVFSKTTDPENCGAGTDAVRPFRHRQTIAGLREAVRISSGGRKRGAVQRFRPVAGALSEKAHRAGCFRGRLLLLSPFSTLRPVFGGGSTLAGSETGPPPFPESGLLGKAKRERAGPGDSWPTAYFDFLSLLAVGSELGAAAAAGQFPSLRGAVAATGQCTMATIDQKLYYSVVVGDFSSVRLYVAQSAQVTFAFDRYNLQTPLHEACARGFVECSIFLLEKGAAVDARDSYGCTPMHKAAFFGQLKTCQVLLSRNADVLLRDERGFSSLHYACFCSKADLGAQVLEQLLRFVKVRDLARLVDKEGRSPMHIAALSGSDECIRLLLQVASAFGNSHELLDGKDGAGRTPLFYAVQGKHVQTARMLIREFDVAIHVRDKHGRTPLFWAVETGLADLVQLLLQGKEGVSLEDPNSGSGSGDKASPGGKQGKAGDPAQQQRRQAHSHHQLQFIQDSEGRTALHWAASKGLPEICELMFTNLSQADAKRLANLLDKSAASALHAVALRSPDSSAAECCRLLQSHGANPNQLDAEDRSPLDYACYTGRLEAVRMLVARSSSRKDVVVIDANSRDKTGKTALFWASIQGHLPIVKELLGLPKSVVDVTAKDIHNRNAVFWAVRYNRLDIVRELVARGASVHLKDDAGRTPVFWACEGGFLDLFHFLVGEQGASVDARDSSGKGLVHWSVRAPSKSPGGLGILTFLVGQRGLSPHSPDSMSFYPIHEAASVGNAKSLRFLFENYNKDHVVVVDVFAKSSDGRTARDLAVAGMHKEAMNVIMEEEARRNVLIEQEQRYHRLLQERPSVPVGAPVGNAVFDARRAGSALLPPLPSLPTAGGSQTSGPVFAGASGSTIGSSTAATATTTTTAATTAAAATAGGGGGGSTALPPWIQSGGLAAQGFGHVPLPPLPPPPPTMSSVSETMKDAAGNSALRAGALSTTKSPAADRGMGGGSVGFWNAGRTHHNEKRAHGLVGYSDAEEDTDEDGKSNRDRFKQTNDDDDGEAGRIGGIPRHPRAAPGHEESMPLPSQFHSPQSAVSGLGVPDRVAADLGQSVVLRRPISMATRTLAIALLRRLRTGR